MRHILPKFIFASLLALSAGAPSLQASSAPLTAEESTYFETFIRPTLLTECVECHGADKQKGGLRLDSRLGWEKGGDSGSVIVPRKPESSLLLRSIQHLEPDLKMPEKAPKLDDAIIAHFSKWIEMGAPDPRDAPPVTSLKPTWPDLLAARRTWWAFQPLKHIPPQTSEPTKFAIPPGHPVDRLLNDAIQKAGLTTAPTAPADQIARRLYFVLTGLPPAPDELRSFVTGYAQDPSDAVRSRANSLMQTPAFGEHWARHWMDLVRYAESHGSEGDPEIPNAFQYRDYLIRAFNADVPLDQLIREHIAGDLFSNPRISPSGIQESRLGPAHLRMNEHGFQPVDTLDDQIKTVDNQIDVVTKAFQGLTVSCARCHDHKFDAVSQKDYTALYGIFSSVRPAQLVTESAEMLQLSKKGDLRNLKGEMRQELSRLWIERIERFEDNLRRSVAPASQETSGGGTSNLALASRLKALEDSISTRQWAEISGDKPRKAPAPYAVWNFQQGQEDRLGRIRSELLGGARVENGALLLDGKGAHLKTAPLPLGISERTYEAWVSSTNLEQKGGGIIGLERISAHGFDSLVYGEKQRRKWLAGSNNFRRTEQTDGEEESSMGTAPVHLAISYAKDGTISLFRNGRPYGSPYRKDVCLEFPEKDARLLVGLRHSGAGNGFFEGQIREVRLHTRALTVEEVASSYSEGPLGGGLMSKPNTAAQSADASEIQSLIQEAAQIREQLSKSASSEATNSILQTASSTEHPLHIAIKAATLSQSAFAEWLPAYRSSEMAKLEAFKKFNAVNFTEMWQLDGKTAAPWFLDGPDVEQIFRGDFRVQTEGATLLNALLPAGIAASSLVEKFGGAAMSPDFKINSESISLRFAATDGAMARLIPDHYPLGVNPIFPRAIVQRAQSAWTRLDATYRMGSTAYLEWTTPAHQTRRAEPPKKEPAFGKKPFFVVESIAFHSGKEPPKEVRPGLELVLQTCAEPSPSRCLGQLKELLKHAVEDWRHGRLSEGQLELLNAALESNLLPTNLDASETLASLTKRYRGMVESMPTPTTVPGVLESFGKDAPFLPRGDYKKPGDLVSRAFLEVLDARPILSQQSGRQELAEKLTNAGNPLTARVMVNRIWLWTFGAGIVRTPDNFGRMGEKPTHPDLLDFLAGELQRRRWSLKEMLVFLVTTDVFQRASLAPDSSLEKDPENALLTHWRVRRLEAECIRDSMLSASGVLDRKLYGPPADQNGTRRSVYLPQRRNSLPAFLTTFDAPKPFTTVGRRDSTTVPAQSLTLLNDPNVLKLAKVWSERVSKEGGTLTQQIQRLFEIGFNRPASAQELQQAQELLQTQESGADLSSLAHALFNLKEFIYLR